jgi:hypothetical protein
MVNRNGGQIPTIGNLQLFCYYYYLPHPLSLTLKFLDDTLNVISIATAATTAADVSFAIE